MEYQGVGGPNKNHAVNLIFSPQHIDILFLQETKISNPPTSIICRICGSLLSGWTHVNALDTHGGLITAWNEHV